MNFILTLYSDKLYLSLFQLSARHFNKAIMKMYREKKYNQVR